MTYNYSRSRFWRKHKTPIIFGGLIALTTLFSIPDMMSKASKLGAIREEATQNTFNAIRVKQNDETDQQLRAIANERMKRGCVLVVDGQSAKNLVTLTPGQQVRDRANRSSLPDGVTVCGANGETAVIRNGVISDIAVGDRENIYPNLRRIKGASVYYNTPKISDNK